MLGGFEKSAHTMYNECDGCVFVNTSRNNLSISQNFGGEALYLPSTIQGICLVHQELTNRLDIHQDTVMTQVYLSRRLCGVFNTEAHHDLRA
jgi:hypothetical protein